jgi:hypothetical protein
MSLATSSLRTGTNRNSCMSYPWVETKELVGELGEQRGESVSEWKRDVRAETLEQKNWFRSSATSDLLRFPPFFKMSENSSISKMTKHFEENLQMPVWCFKDLRLGCFPPKHPNNVSELSIRLHEGLMTSKRIVIDVQKNFHKFKRWEKDLSK